MIGTVDELKDFAQARGVTIGDSEAPIHLTKATDFMAGKCWIGTAETEDAPWPRILTPGEAAVTPKAITTAVYRLCMEIAAGVDLEPTVAGAQMVRQTVGPITVQYAEETIGAAPSFPWFDSLVGAYLECEDAGDYGNFDLFRG